MSEAADRTSFFGSAKPSQESSGKYHGDESRIIPGLPTFLKGCNEHQSNPPQIM